jgi:hypothetical protein
MCPSGQQGYPTTTLENVSVLHFKPVFDTTKKLIGYHLLADGDLVVLDKSYSFEFKNDVPIKISHLYMGSETMKLEDFQLLVETERPSKVKIVHRSRAEIFIEEMK